MGYKQELSPAWSGFTNFAISFTIISVLAGTFVADQRSRPRQSSSARQGPGRQPVLGRHNRARQDRWVFGHRVSGAYLHEFVWTNIVRHQMVMGAASPDGRGVTRSQVGRVR
jgi:hypothetical protein